ncbi:hypothetical protein chiPu_0031093, partial [Chiloscyllium punctatum]|nr:hypothetical protein [Chiloscyllium punctatum]
MSSFTQCHHLRTIPRSIPAAQRPMPRASPTTAQWIVQHPSTPPTSHPPTRLLLGTAPPA